MTLTEKYLVRTGIAGVALLLIAIAAVGVPGHDPGPVSTKRKATKTPETPARAEVSAVAQAPASQTVSDAPANLPAVTEAIAPLPANATSVPDEYLLKLSGMVDLANARYHRPDKARWGQAIPIAQKLLDAPCDCEQRNWLNRFVEMGNYALADTDDRYGEYATLMATLGRNDKDAMALSRKAN